MKLIFESPISPLSFGQVGYNILKSLYKLDIDVGFFPMGNIDLSCFNVTKEFHSRLQDSINKRHSFLKRETPSLKLWHLLGSESLRTENQTLLTFYECSSPTEYEKNICNFQTRTLFSSSYAKNLFEKAGCNNTGTFFCGSDPEFFVSNKTYLTDKVVWTLIGKWERRKSTEQIIKCWIQKYGNNLNHTLNLLVHNPFFSQEDNARLLQAAFDGKRYWNVNILPRLKTNAEVNDLLNATDIDLSGLSMGEGWGLPAFQATALGKWSIVSNHTSHKDWATKDNSILVEPDEEVPVYDGVFFKPDSIVNHGVFFKNKDETIIDAFERAEKKVGEKNQNGLDMGVEMTYDKSVEEILSNF